MAGPAGASGSAGQGAEDGSGSSPSGALANPAPDWLTEKSWSELVGLADLPAYKGIAQHVASNLKSYKDTFDSSQVGKQQRLYH